jgi:hypothetical protein
LIKSVSMIDLQARFTARLSDGRKVFVKAGGCDVHGRRERSLNRLAREKICLDRLQGLAVPRRVRLKRGELGGLLGPRAVAVAQACVPGYDLDKAGFSDIELLGAWAFVAEQLVAFRRLDILYTDVKCRNIMATREPLSVLVVDFDLATAVSPEGTYDTSVVGYTQGYEAPEQPGSELVTERTLVYQLGILLPHCLVGTDNASLRGARRGLKACRSALEALGAAALAPIVEACLSPRPSDRPRDYERLWSAVRGNGRSPLPPAALEVWKALRAPYARRLAEVDLDADRV